MSLFSIFKLNHSLVSTFFFSTVLFWLGLLLVPWVFTKILQVTIPLIFSPVRAEYLQPGAAPPVDGRQQAQALWVAAHRLYRPLQGSNQPPFDPGRCPRQLSITSGFWHLRPGFCMNYLYLITNRKAC